jgi:tyrosyl-tRNA synthetase
MQSTSDAFVDLMEKGLFGKDPKDCSLETLDVLYKELGHLELDFLALKEGVCLSSILHLMEGMATSRSAANKLIVQGGIYVNGKQVNSDVMLTLDDLLHDTYIVLRRGKKMYSMIKGV